MKEEKNINHSATSPTIMSGRNENILIGQIIIPLVFSFAKD